MQQLVNLAHRGAHATRTTSARWHPYHHHNSLSGGGAQVQPAPPSHLVSPPVHKSLNSRSSLATSASSSFGPSIADMQSKAQKGSISKETRDKVASLLIDQAVKQLMLTWRPENIPDVYMSSTYGAQTSSSSLAASPSTLSRLTNGQLPSPVSPSTRPSPAVNPPVIPVLSRPDPPMTHPQQPNPIVPLRSFVHEVLRRSRTSCSTLQTALCYLEAVGPRIPAIVEAEKRGEGIHNEQDVEWRIEIAIPTQSETKQDPASVCAPPSPALSQANSQLTDTVCVSSTVGLESAKIPACEIRQASAPALPGPGMKRRPIPPKPTTALPPLPHPLLCPRRTFMAALILASKFMQDKSYSNRAWAKLSGLPPREISRCERALGNALEWRLWVGKVSEPAGKLGEHGAAVEPTVSRSLGRARSEGNLTPTPHSDGDRTPTRPLSRTVTAPELTTTPSVSRVSFTDTQTQHELSPCPTLSSSATPTTVGSSSSESSTLAEFPNSPATAERSTSYCSFSDSKALPSFGALSDSLNMSLALPDLAQLGYSPRGPFIVNHETSSTA